MGGSCRVGREMWSGAGEGGVDSDVQQAGVKEVSRLQPNTSCTKSAGSAR